MGSQGRRRGRRTRSDDGGSRVDITNGVGFPEFEHNQWTFEGRIERLAAFARGAPRTAGWRRVAVNVVALLVLLPFVVTLVAWVINLRF